MEKLQNQRKRNEKSSSSIDSILAQLNKLHDFENKQKPKAVKKRMASCHNLVNA